MVTRAESSSSNLGSHEGSHAHAGKISQGLTHDLKAIEIPDRLFFKIGDVAELVGVKPYVLRYWETEFPMISPQKSDTGQRVYRRSDVETVCMIKRLLHQERYSIEGARKRIKELRSGGDLKTFKKLATGVNASEAEGVSLTSESNRQAKDLAKELKKLSQTPINKLFSL